MERDEGAEDETGGDAVRHMASRELSFPPKSAPPTAKYTADRNLLSRSLSFKLRSRQFISGGRGQRSAEAPSRQIPNVLTSLKTDNIESKDDGLKMLPSVGTTANQIPSPISPTIAATSGHFDWDAMSDVLPCDTTSHRAAMNAVEFKQSNGIFVHRDKYAAGRFTKHCHYSPTPSGETIIITTDSEYLLPSRNTGSKSGRHVAWAPVTEIDGPVNDYVRKSVLTPASHRSESSSTNRPKFISKRNKVDHININWKMSQMEKKKSAEKEKRFGRLSKNILPVTIGVDYRGQSVSKTKWLVPSLPTHDPSQVWQKCLNFVKQNTTLW